MSDNSVPPSSSGFKQDPLVLERLFSALGNATRILILKKLARFPPTENDQGGMYPGDLAEHLQITKQGVMKHLDLLEKAGLVESYERENPPIPGPNRIYYGLTPIARRLLNTVENYETPENFSQAREKLESAEVPEDMQVIANAEKELLQIDERLSAIDRERQELLDKRYEVNQRIRQATDEIITNRFRDMLQQEKFSLDNMSVEREILHSFFDNPMQAFLGGMDIEDLLESTFAQSAKFERGRWEPRILQFLEELGIIKRDARSNRFSLFFE